eukprot:473075-Amphidinium_carterae.1
MLKRILLGLEKANPVRSEEARGGREQKAIDGGARGRTRRPRSGICANDTQDYALQVFDTL